MSDVFQVLDLLTGYQKSAAVTAAARLGVFDTLAGQPSTSEGVAAVLGTDPLATRALLDALVGLGLLTIDVDGYRAVEVARRLGDHGDLRSVVEKEAFFARTWLSLADSVRTGQPQLAPWSDRVAADPAHAHAFLDALVVLAAETGPDLTQLPGVGPGATIADLGGGLGSYALPLARAGAQVLLVELDAVAGWAQQRRATAAQDRVTVCSADLLAPDAAERILFDSKGFDVVLCAHLLHDLSDGHCRQVLKVARQVCRPGGQVVVVELPGDPPGAFGPMFDLMMRIETPGRARRVSELVALLEDAGFSDVELSARYRRPNAVLTGRR